MASKEVGMLGKERKKRGSKKSFLDEKQGKLIIERDKELKK